MAERMSDGANGAESAPFNAPRISKDNKKKEGKNGPNIIDTDFGWTPFKAYIHKEEAPKPPAEPVATPSETVAVGSTESSLTTREEAQKQIEAKLREYFHDIKQRVAEGGVLSYDKNITDELDVLEDRARKLGVTLDQIEDFRRQIAREEDFDLSKLQEAVVLKPVEENTETGGFSAEAEDIKNQLETTYRELFRDAKETMNKPDSIPSYAPNLEDRVNALEDQAFELGVPPSDIVAFRRKIAREEDFNMSDWEEKFSEGRERTAEANGTKLSPDSPEARELHDELQAAIVGAAYEAKEKFERGEPLASPLRNEKVRDLRKRYRQTVANASKSLRILEDQALAEAAFDFHELREIERKRIVVPGAPSAPTPAAPEASPEARRTGSTPVEPLVPPAPPVGPEPFTPVRPAPAAPEATEPLGPPVPPHVLEQQRLVREAEERRQRAETYAEKVAAELNYREVTARRNRQEAVDPLAAASTERMLYQFATGITLKDNEPVPPNFEMSPVMRNTAETFYMQRQKLLAAYEAEYKAAGQVKKSGGEEGRAGLDAAVVWRENAEITYNDSLEKLKVALWNDFIRKKAEQYPNLSKAELEAESLKFGATSILEMAKNTDLELERMKADVALNAKEKSRVKAWWESYQRMPRWKRWAVNALIAGGTGAAVAFAFPAVFGLTSSSLVAAAGMGGVRMFRSGVGAVLGGGIYSALDKWWLKGKFAKERAKAKQLQVEGTPGEAAVAARPAEGGRPAVEARPAIEGVVGTKEKITREVAGTPDWLLNEEKKLKLAEIIDQDAVKYREALDKIGKKERRYKMVTALASGILGGAAANIGDWYLGGTSGVRAASLSESVPGGGRVAAVPPAIPGAGGGGVPAAELYPGEHLGEQSVRASIEAGKEGMTTIQEGDSLWKVTRHIAKEAGIDDSQWSDGFENSTVEIIKRGVKTEVPMSSVGLIHPGDQVWYTMESGQVRFHVSDAGSVMKMSNDQMYAENLISRGKAVPEWLQKKTGLGIRPRAGAIANWASEDSGAGLVEGSNATAAIENNIDGTRSFPVPEEILKAPLAKHLFTDSDIANQLKAFNKLSLDDQENEIGWLRGQRHMWDQMIDKKPELAETYRTYISDTFRSENTLAASPGYIQNLELFREMLDQNGITPGNSRFYELVKGLKIKEFSDINAAAEAQADLYKSAWADVASIHEHYGREWDKLVTLVNKFKPGAPEMRLTIDQFLKKLL